MRLFAILGRSLSSEEEQEIRKSLHKMNYQRTSSHMTGMLLSEIQSKHPGRFQPRLTFDEVSSNVLLGIRIHHDGSLLWNRFFFL